MRLMAATRKSHRDRVASFGGKIRAPVMASVSGMTVEPQMQLQRLFTLEEHLRGRIRGQAHALQPLAAAVLRAACGLESPGRFLLLGPTGVGKTETALAFTEFLFGVDHLERFD